MMLSCSWIQAREFQVYPSWSTIVTCFQLYTYGNSITLKVLLGFGFSFTCHGNIYISIFVQTSMILPFHGNGVVMMHKTLVLNMVFISWECIWIQNRNLACIFQPCSPFVMSFWPLRNICGLQDACDRNTLRDCVCVCLCVV